MLMRLRLRFDEACSCKGDGLLQWWFAVGPEMGSIGDLARAIVSSFQLERSCPNGILLSMEDFGLPPMQPVSLLKDKDIVSVKPFKVALTDERRTLGNVELRAIEEFEKESGGYKSEDENLLVPDHSTDDTFGSKYVVKALALKNKPEKKRAEEATPRKGKRKSKPADSPRAKRSKKMKKVQLSSGKAAEKKAEVSSDDDEVAEEGNPKSDTKAERKAAEVCSDDEGDDDDESDEADAPKPGNKLAKQAEAVSSEEETSAEEEAPKLASRQEENGVGNIGTGNSLKSDDQQGAKADVHKEYRPSRSARRKKLKRAWRRRAEAEAKQKFEETKLVESQKKHVSEDVNNDGLSHPMVVRPGHIRFEPLESDVEQEIRTMPCLNIATGVKSKRHGQNWGQEKQKSNAGSKTWENGAAAHQDAVSDMQVEKTPATDFDKLPWLDGKPKKGDNLAYKLLELTQAMTPEISAYRVGQVVSFSETSNIVLLSPVAGYPVPRQEDNDSYAEDGTLEIPFSELLNVRVLRRATENLNENHPKGAEQTPAEANDLTAWLADELKRRKQELIQAQRS